MLGEISLNRFDFVSKCVTFFASQFRNERFDGFNTSYIPHLRFPRFTRSSDSIDEALSFDLRDNFRPSAFQLIVLYLSPLRPFSSHIKNSFFFRRLNWVWVPF